MTRNINLSLLAKSGASLLAIAVACSASAAVAQTAPGGTAAPSPSGGAVDEKAGPTATEEVIVVGTRASQQSAIDRKKRAKTATDSIVADDIGSFPDRNVSEAMSRLPGVALNRNDFGEGEGVSIRGNAMGQTRVELDGIGVQGTNALGLGADGGRSADLRELPAELVKSIDVVKGSTADMTEGSLGGGILVKTRSGLDFKKPYYSLRVGGSRNSLSRKITPDLNAVASHKFFDDRLGIIASGTYNHFRNDSHRMETTTSGSRGYAALFDFDRSAEKTFQFNPATVGTDAADVPFPNSLAPDGSSLTPREFVTLAAGAQSQAQCLQIFPHNPTATPAQRGQRIVEQQSCLNQWNDYTPSLIRHFTPYQDEKRYAIDARADYRVTDNLTVYAKVTQANRKVDDQFSSRNPISLFNQNLAGTFQTSTTGYPRTRTVSPTAEEGYFLFDPTYGLNNVGNNAVLGNVINIRPGSVVVDEKHNVTGMTLTNNSVNIDQIANVIDTKTRYIQGGAEWRLGRLQVDGMAGMTSAKTTRGDMRTGRSYTYGDATLALQPNGLWDIALPAGYDETNTANFVQLFPARCVGNGTPPNCIGQNAVVAGPTAPASPAYTVGQMPLTTPNFGVSYSPSIGEAGEKIAKLDATFDTAGMLPFFTRFKTGAMYRNNKISFWGGGGKTISSAVGTFGQPGYVPAVILPRALVRGSLRACEPTAGSSAPGGLSCNYGFVPSTNPSFVREGVETVTPDELRNLFSSTLDDQIAFFRGLPNRGSLPEGWRGIRTDALFQQLDAYKFMNFDCVKTCTASDGNVYDQPVTRTNETIKNIYAMFDFEQRLPLGLLFNGNIGVRGVITNVGSTGSLTLNSITVTPSYNPLAPNTPGGFVTQTFTQNVVFKDKSRAWLPTVNLNLWAFDEKLVLRAYGGRTVSRPPVSRLTPAGTCTIDERESLEADGPDPFGCSGRLGNPALKPYTAASRNLSLEWYPNRDTLFSIAYGRLNVKIGDPVAATRTSTPFAGSSEVDPVTGQALANIQFTYPTWENGPGFKRSIWEFGTKTAFSFLPWMFRYTGVDANISILNAKVSRGIQDPLSGDIMPPAGQSKYYTNVSLWYDDGRLNMRVAYQNRSARFNCITPCGGNNVNINYPGEGWSNVRMVAPGYNPGGPLYNDSEKFVDAKASYNITKNLQVYLEGRNLTKTAQIISDGGYSPFADGTPRVYRLAYPGRRIMGGATLKFGN